MNRQGLLSMSKPGRQQWTQPISSRKSSSSMSWSKARPQADERLERRAVVAKQKEDIDDSSKNNSSRIQGRNDVDDVEGDDDRSHHSGASSLTSPSFSSLNVNANSASVQLQQLLNLREWSDALLLLKSNRSGVSAKDVVSIPLKDANGDYPLHNVCDWDYFPEEGEGTGHTNANESLPENEAGKKIKLKAKKKNNDRRFKPLEKSEMVPPPFELIKLILDAYPRAARLRGHEGCLPIH